jgi:hypothetical protein
LGLRKINLAGRKVDGGYSIGTRFFSRRNRKEKDNPKDMDSNTTPAKLLAQSEEVARVWKENPDLILNDASVEDYLRISKELRDTMEEMAELGRQLRIKAIQRGDLAEQLNDLTIRVRGLVGGALGLNSIEYALVGGTPTSKRQKPGPKGPRSRD